LQGYFWRKGRSSEATCATVIANAQLRNFELRAWAGRNPLLRQG
jgi:hypothetical protein